MSEDRTKKLNEPNSFEERFDRMEIRITKLEDRQHDTKPIWERALADIAESRAELKADIAESRAELKADIAGLKTEVDALHTQMKAEFVTIQHKMEHELRRVGRQIDVLNQTFLQIQADQRYVDRRLEELETQIEPR